MVRRGEISSGVVWRGVAWCCVLWRGAAWCVALLVGCVRCAMRRFSGGVQVVSGGFVQRCGRSAVCPVRSRAVHLQLQLVRLHSMPGKMG